MSQSRKNLLAGAILGIVIIVIIFGYKIAQAPSADVRTVTARLGGHSFLLKVADTNRLRIQGLADRPELTENEGMLFVFDQPGIDCFWMKDVHYSLDILWFDADKKLVHTEKSVVPDSYPNSFCPPKPSLYVVEVRAGVTDKLDLSNEQVLHIDGL